MLFRRARNRRLNPGQKLDVKLRSTEARAARTRFASLAVFVAIGTVLGLYFLWRAGEWSLNEFVYENPAFAIGQVDIQTDGLIAPDQLRRWSGVKPGANLIALDLAAVKRNLELVSTIETVSIERILPRTLIIRVTERRPVAQVNLVHSLPSGEVAVAVFQLDANGYVMQPLGQRSSWLSVDQVNYEFPAVTGLNSCELQPGHPLKSSQSLAALRLIAAFDHSPMAGVVALQSVDASAPGVLIATTSEGGEITFAPDRLDQQLRRWRQIHDWGKSAGKKIATMDLAVENNIPVTWNFASGAPALTLNLANPCIPGGKMFDEPNLIVGLEIGTSKVCVVVGEVNAEGALNIVGLGQAPSRGVRKGEIVDPPQAEESVRHAIVEAEQMANVEIRNVYLGVTGAHLRGFNNRGVHRVLSADREITVDDVEDVVKNAKTVNLPAANSIVHAVRQHFYLDGQDGVLNPVGMLGSLLEVEVHVVHGITNRLQNAVRLVRGLHLEVDEIIFNGLAASLAMLSNEQKELGALVIDLGGGTTDYVVYANGIIKHTGVFAIGGDHVSNDLGHGLKVPLSRAEKLKLEYGSAIVDEHVKGRTLTLTNEMNLPVRTINLEHLQRIMSLRLEEIFQIIHHDLEQMGLLGYLAGGIFICGGGARTPQIAKLAESVLQAPVCLGQTNSISGLKSALDQPEFLTAIGLAKYGSLKNRKRPATGFFPRFKEIFEKILPPR